MERAHINSPSGAMFLESQKCVEIFSHTHHDRDTTYNKIRKCIIERFTHTITSLHEAQRRDPAHLSGRPNRQHI